jgi:hypothetical protein
MRRAGLFLGTAILGVWCAAWFERGVGAPLQSVLSSSSLIFAAVFVVLGVALAFASHDRFLRSAWIVFAVQHVLNLAPHDIRTPPVAWASSILTGIFATLLIVAGARRRSARALVVAAAVFVGAVILSIAATAYVKRVRNGYSVVLAKASSTYTVTS